MPLIHRPNDPSTSGAAFRQKRDATLENFVWQWELDSWALEVGRWGDGDRVQLRCGWGMVMSDLGTANSQETSARCGRCNRKAQFQPETV